jgi:hypothetical protein
MRPYTTTAGRTLNRYSDLWRRILGNSDGHGRTPVGLLSFFFDNVRRSMRGSAGGGHILGLHRGFYTLYDLSNETFLRWR